MPSRRRKTEKKETAFDVVIVGAGSVGLTLALGLAQKKTKGKGNGAPRILCLEQQPAAARAAAHETTDLFPDARTSALTHSTVLFLKSIGAWDAALDAAPLRALAIVDDQNAEREKIVARFAAVEAGLDQWAFNVNNRTLQRILQQRLGSFENVTVQYDTTLTGLENFSDTAIVRATTGSTPVAYTAPLVVGCDGRQSAVRDLLSIPVTTHDYQAQALVALFDHTTPHDFCSYEIYQPAGPFTTVPIDTPHRSSLVWVVDMAEAARLTTLSDAAFAAAMQQASGNILGKISAVTARQTYPLHRLLARRVTHGRSVLIGEAAHVLNPIGAQGLNLGLRDVRNLLDHDGGEAETLATYAAARTLDTLVTSLYSHGLHHLVTTSFSPAQRVRYASLALLEKMPFLKKGLMAGLSHMA